MNLYTNKEPDEMKMRSIGDSVTDPFTQAARRIRAAARYAEWLGMLALTLARMAPPEKFSEAIRAAHQAGLKALRKVDPDAAQVVESAIAATLDAATKEA